MNDDAEFEHTLRRLAGPVDRRGVWATIEARAGVPGRAVTGKAPAPRRRSKLHVTAYAAVAVVLVAAIAIGSLEAVRYLSTNRSILVIGDQTTVGSTPGRITQHPGQAPATVGMGNGWWVPKSRMWAVKADGSLWAWGFDPTSPSSFARVGSDTDWVTADVNALHYLALKTDGSLWEWGETTGDYWTGFSSVFHSPTRVGSVSGLVAVAAGSDKWLALKSDGSLWECPLAQGTPVGDSPTRVGSDTDWVAVAGGGYYFVALKSDGSLWEWGEYSGHEDHVGSFARLGSDSDWVAISAAGAHSLALKSDGSLWEWGVIVGDPLAEGTVYTESPTRIGSDTGWTAISAGDSHSLALKSDGSLWAWGDNLWGRLGDGTSTTRSNPVRIGSDADWVSIAAGYSQSLAQKADGSLWAWGENLGRSPVKVLAALDGP